MRSLSAAISSILRRRVCVACVTCLALCATGAISDMCYAQSGPPGGRASDLPETTELDRLPRKLERKVLKAVRSGDPRSVSQLLEGKHRSFGAYIARAHTRAGLIADEPADRTVHFEEAAATYREILKLRKDRTWFRGDARRTEVVGWYVELGDVLLRQLLAPDLDRYEITSGLQYDASRILRYLREAHEAYEAAGDLLDDLIIGLRTEEERFLLLGIADRITTLDQQRRLNGAWAGAYLAMIGGEELPDRAGILARSLSAFDSLSRTARDPELKYNALLGAGIALRESARFAEAEMAFERVQHSTASASLVARARYEHARTLIKANRFKEARAALDALAAVSTTQTDDSDTSATFYVRLAPLIGAYTYFLEARRLTPNSQLQRDELRHRGREEMLAIANRGGIWPTIVEVYENAIAEADGSDDRPSVARLQLQARQAMSGGDYAEAVAPLQAILDHEDADATARQEASFNLAVCHFQRGKLRQAAETFTDAAKAGESDHASQAAEYAYRCWRQLAAEIKARADYLRLARAAEASAEHVEESSPREDVEWIAALARQEAGDYGSAQTAYSRITRDSQHYWPARRNIARCRQSIFDELTDAGPASRQRRAARDAIEAWTDLAAKLEREIAPDNELENLHGIGRTEDASAWIRDAKLSAATLLADEVVRGFDEALRLLDRFAPSPRVLALRIRCHRGLGNIEAANQTLESFLSQASGPEFGSILARLAADMEHETESLRSLGRRQEARRVAADMAAILRQLLAWLETHPANERHAAIIRFSLARALRQAGEFAEAMEVLDELMQRHPKDGGYLREAALTQEELAEVAAEPKRAAEYDLAEALWEKLLRDESLRDNAPNVYWEARYHWLRHQLRKGHAAMVARAIDTERAWYPALGGPPWQGKLLDLAVEARRKIASESQPAKGG